MHPDVGAIIGIALAGSVLAVAILMLCIFHVPWPCWKNLLRLRPVSLRAANGNRRAVRPSATSSQAPFASTHDNPTIRTREYRVSVMDLHTQNQAHICSASGIVNPVWQMHCTCHSGMMTASQQSLNFAHCHPISACQFQHPHVPQHPVSIADVNNATTELSSFQYYSPQLVSPSDSPPPYPGLAGNNNGSSTVAQVAMSQTVTTTNPPPYSPKH